MTTKKVSLSRSDLWNFFNAIFCTLCYQKNGDIVCKKRDQLAFLLYTQLSYFLYFLLRRMKLKWTVSYVYFKKIITNRQFSCELYCILFAKTQNKYKIMKIKISSTSFSIAAFDYINPKWYFRKLVMFFFSWCNL